MQDNAEFAVEPVLDALERFFCFARFFADAGHDAHALRLDEDLPLGAVSASDGLAERVVGSAEPCAVPARVQDGFLHLGCGFVCTGCLFGQTEVTEDSSIGSAVFDKHACDEHGLCDGPFAGTGDLEALAGMCGEAVEVQAVVPVGPPDERQLVRPQMRDGIAEAAAKMLHEGRRIVLIAVKRHAFLQNRPVACFAQVCVHACDEPERVVVEAAADGKVAFLCERLVLMVRAAVRELRGGDIKNTLSRAPGNDMDKAK